MEKNREIIDIEPVNAAKKTYFIAKEIIDPRFPQLEGLGPIKRPSTLIGAIGGGTAAIIGGVGYWKKVGPIRGEDSLKLFVYGSTLLAYTIIDIIFNMKYEAQRRTN